MDATPGTARVRDPRLDVLKALAILLVVLGHCIILVYGGATRAPFVVASAFSVLSVLDVPLFVFVAGYLAKPGAGLQWLGSRAERLLVPFAAWTVLQWFVFTRGQGGTWFANVVLHPTRSNAWFLLVLFELCALYVVFGRSTPLLVAIALAGLLWPANLGDIFALTYVTMLFPVLVAGRLAAERRFEPGWWVLPVAAAVLVGMWTVPGANLLSVTPVWVGRVAILAGGGGAYPVGVLVRFLRLGLELALIGSAFYLFKHAKRGAWLGALTLGIYCAHPFFLPLWLAASGRLADLAIAFAVTGAGGVGAALLLARWRAGSWLLLGTAQRPWR